MAEQSADNPFGRLPNVPTFLLRSADIGPGGQLAFAQMSGLFGVEGGQDISPQLSWSNQPRGTKSFALTMFDPDSPTGSGYWHWAIANLSANVFQLPSDAGNGQLTSLPPNATPLANDARIRRYVGAFPAAGGWPHRYIFSLHALDVRRLNIEDYATPAALGLAMLPHVIARGSLIATSQIDSANYRVPSSAS